MSLAIQGSDELPAASPGDFGAVIEDNRLLLPWNVADAARQLSLRNADEFVSYSHAFPTAVASTLRWPAESVSRAATRLASALKHDLSTPADSSPRRVYGALDPHSKRD